MNLIFAKLYEEYKRKKDPAKLSITFYISIVYFFLTIVFILPIKTIIDKKIFDDNIQYKKSTIMTVVFGLLIVITYFVHNLYIKKKPHRNFDKKIQRQEYKQSAIVFNCCFDTGDTFDNCRDINCIFEWRKNIRA